MPLFLKPHTATRWTPDQNVEGSTYAVQGVLYGDPQGMCGQLLPLTQQASFDRTGIAVERPHEWLWDSAVDIAPQSLLKIGERWFLARVPQEVFDAEPVTAHRRIVIEEIEADAVEAAHEGI